MRRTGHARGFQALARRIPPMPIGTFIGILHLLIAILGAGVITLFALFFIYQSGEQSNLREVKDLVIIAENALEDPFQSFQAGSLTLGDVQNTLARYLEGRPEVRFAFLSPDGIPYPASGPLALESAGDRAGDFGWARVDQTSSSIHIDASGQRMIYVARPIDKGSSVYGILVLGIPFNVVMAPTYRAMVLMSVIALLIVAFTVGEGWLGSVYISKPIVRLSRVAEQLSQGDLNTRADERGPVEVVHLARTLNQMAGRVQSSLNSLRAFVGNASHELRTPLTSIKLQVGALRAGACEEPEVAERFLSQIDNEIDRLVHMVNDMLDLSQLEGGGTAPDFQPVNLIELSSEVQAFWETRARQSGITLGLNTPEDLPRAKGDPFQLRRLFDNLLDNAIKNTPRGGQVSIVLRMCPADERGKSQQNIRVEINDNGIGIAPEHLSHIFERFYRIDTRPVEDRQRQHGDHPAGSGLGLAIARSIVIAHHGTIGVSSQPGMGSTFWVELPVCVGNEW